MGKNSAGSGRFHTFSKFLYRRAIKNAARPAVDGRRAAHGSNGEGNLSQRLGGEAEPVQALLEKTREKPLFEAIPVFFIRAQAQFFASVHHYREFFLVVFAKIYPGLASLGKGKGKGEKIKH